VPPTELAAGSVPEGRVRDFLTGKLVRDTAEEYVRQNVERALVRQYQYSPADCEPEYRIKVGSARKRIDIVVFEPGLEHSQDTARILVETKKPKTRPSDKKEGVEQLKSYMAACVNAQYGLWTNGDAQVCLAKRTTSKGLAFEEIIDIPAYGQSEEDAQRPARKDLKPATADNLLFAFRRCHNYIAGTEGKQKPDAFWELLKIIFCKIEDERGSRIDFYATPSERTSSTTAVSARTRIQKLFEEKVVRKYPSIFPSSDQTIDLKPSVLAYVVSQLQGYSLLRSPVDVKGVAYEEIVGSNLRGDRGEFFTPRNACRMAVGMINPQPGERLLDPACGTGGFLIIAMNRALDLIEQAQRSDWQDPAAGTREEHAELHRSLGEYLREHVFGIDLNPSLVRAAKMNMVMNNDGSGGLYQGDSLANPHTWDPALAAVVPLASVDIVVTNPPFGANIVIDDQDILIQYELAAKWDFDDAGRWTIRKDEQGRHVLQKNQPPEILFIERCVQFVRPAMGRVAMVIPNGILNNPALGYVRQWMYENVQILAVVDMARELFQPKNDTQTSMVLMRRLSPQEKAEAMAGRLDYPVFMAVAEKVGHDKRGNIIYRRSETGDDILVEVTERVSEVDPETGVERVVVVSTHERVVDDELPEVAQAYAEWLRETLG
jgi:type I restriction enzyme M protein